MSAVLSFLSVKWQRYDRQGKCLINRLFSAADILKRPAVNSFLTILPAGRRGGYFDFD
ncbi:hypothetical protein B4125_1875 [Bacillus paralicheniformis]|uniref:Uncharacterized protein n=1 Tax=Bacillus paralicheniformis TaxID=1648923 RepID=A0A7Z0WVZ7_9BACI|nr:hypothetical protein SC10_B2orf03492 [Bacillus paralicheniformis]OLF90005.1 hypothetical protein B4121_3280 [Bacillus paralicheniformis]OLG07694.1 hypothetical protein B4125_1875 [Bacillus paralicheniformis]TWJ37426.1 hypothetical protein CHCC5027_0924 [Bacillus paralicheniformis]TWJ58515.1 hypothetical protein CHCC5022_3370 [Bacillus paralicheniformis]